MESTIYINSTLREARAGTTGAGLPEVTLTLLAQWLCHVRFFASGEDPALLDTPAFVLSIKETPTGTALVRTETSAENDDGDGYDFEFESIDGESLRALLGDEPSLDLVLEIEWTVDSVTERVHMPCTVINAYNRPDDTAPDPAEAETDAWLTARAVRHDSAQTLTTDQKTQARSNIGAAASTHTHTIADVSGLQTALDGKSSSGHSHSNATTSAAGFMSASDKAKLDGLGEGSDLDETVAAVAQVSEITVNGTGALDLDGDYLDIDIGEGAVVRVWFDLDNASSPPSAPGTGRLLEVDLLSSDDTGGAAGKIATAINADPDLTASAVSNTITLTQPAGLLDEPVSTDGTNLAVNVTTTGAEAYNRIIEIDGSQITNLTAENVNIGTANRILASPADNAQGAPRTLTQVIDAALGGFVAQGTMLIRGSSEWQALAGSGLIELTAGADAALKFEKTVGLTSGVSSSSASFGNVTGLTVNLPGAGTYAIHIKGTFTGSATTEGVGLAVNGPSASLVAVGIGYGATTTYINAFSRHTAYDDGPLLSQSGGSTSREFCICGVVTVTTSGTLAMRFRAETGGANSATIDAGTTMTVRKL